MKKLDAPREPSLVPGVSRRVLTAGGVTLVAAFAGCRSTTAVSVPATGVAASPRAAAESARVAAARVQAIENVRKPVFIPERRNRSRVVLARRHALLDGHPDGACAVLRDADAR